MSQLTIRESCKPKANSSTLPYYTHPNIFYLKMMKDISLSANKIKSPRARSSSRRSSTGSTSSSRSSKSREAAPRLSPHEMIQMLETMASRDGEMAFESLQAMKNSPALTPSRRKKTRSVKGKKPIIPAFGRSQTS